MENCLQRLKEAYQQAKQEQGAVNATLQNITINTQTKEITFHWQDAEK
ncbi:MAG: hypothetical protein ACOX4N_06705 [Dethiobacteraceae bacterium]|jgi:endonuclease IV|nr:hypothetical protein [Bacillota bacterium]